MRKTKDTGPRVCALHNNGDHACDPSCIHRLGVAQESEAPEVEEPAPEVDYGPQRCAFHVGGMHCPPECDGRISDSPAVGQGDLEVRNTHELGPASVDEMDEAMADVQRRQLAEDEE